MRCLFMKQIISFLKACDSILLLGGPLAYVNKWQENSYSDWFRGSYGLREQLQELFTREEKKTAIEEG